MGAEIKEKIHAADKSVPVLSVSVMNNTGMKALKSAIIELADKSEIQAGAAQKDVGGSSAFMAERESIDDDAEIQYPGSEN